MPRAMTAMKFVRLVENRLGWHPHDKAAASTQYKAMVRKVEAKIAENPELYTWRNLELAVELLRRERTPRNPLGVFAHVERAVKLARDVEDDVEIQIRWALRFEQFRGDPEGWVTRFARAVGPYRAEVLAEYKASRP